MKSTDLLLRAITLMGSRKKMIQLLNISPQRLNAWLNGSVDMGYEYAIAIEYLTYGKVKAKDLAPKKAKIVNKLDQELFAGKTMHHSPIHQKIVDIVSKYLTQVLSDPSADYEIKRINHLVQ
jgi:DNA-binding transcriptional regulator YdaS (Cro superfamily)